MSLGYDTFEDNRDFEQKGLTGDVKRYTTESLAYPCFIVTATEENQIEAYKLSVLKNMFANVSTYDEDEANLAIHLYFHQGEKTVKFGKIYPKQVKSFLKLFERNIVEGFYDKDTILTDEYLYVLSD